MAGPAKDASLIAALEQQIATLQEQVARLQAMNTSDTRLSTSFVPVASTDCYGVKPCLHSTPISRIEADCTHAVWAGTFGDGKWVRLVPWNTTSSSNTTSVSPSQPEYFPQRSECEQASGGHTCRPVAPPHRRIPPDLFRPLIGDQCDLTDVWKLTRLFKGHVKMAETAHWHQRLRGVKHALWLAVGSSIDYGVWKEACYGFGAKQYTIDADDGGSRLPAHLQHEKGNPWPSTLLVSWCHVEALNSTFAHVTAQGIATTALQTNASLQPLRFAEIGAQLQRIGAHGFGGEPTFLSFGGIEWDFKNWRCLFPRAATEWREPLRGPMSTLEMQADAARAAWPSLRAVFVRTTFHPTAGGGGFNCECCARERDYERYNELLRGSEAISASSREGRAHAIGEAAGQGQDAAVGETSARGREVAISRSRGRERLAAAECMRIRVLDLQRLMMCTDAVGSCSSSTGWTVDGLHPSRPILLGFVAIALQVMADWGAVCR